MPRPRPTFHRNLQLGTRIVTRRNGLWGHSGPSRIGAILLTGLLLAGLLLCGLGVGAGSAQAAAYLPPRGELFAGVTDEPVSAYVQAVGKHPVVYQEFVAWGQYLPGITADATAAHARQMMAIGTAFGPREMITPAGIAAGRGDRWLIGLGQAIYQSHNVTYVRLMAEMDGYWNFYSAFNADGSPRDAAHAAAQYRRAWKRVALILRGGRLSVIDAELRRLRMPPLAAGHDLPRPKVAMLWVPESPPGDPAVSGNSPRNYWPGRRWVDWVGTDFYSKFPNFAGLTSLYNAYRGLPFVFGEYALWGGDDPGFPDRLLGWIRRHRRVRMLVYNQGARATGPFRLWRYPKAARELRRLLGSPRFPAYAPEWAP